jgi:hypothetical protein
MGSGEILRCPSAIRSVLAILAPPPTSEASSLVDLAAGSRCAQPHRSRCRPKPSELAEAARSATSTRLPASWRACCGWQHGVLFNLEATAADDFSPAVFTH